MELDARDGKREHVFETKEKAKEFHNLVYAKARVKHAYLRKTLPRYPGYKNKNYSVHVSYWSIADTFDGIKLSNMIKGL